MKGTLYTLESAISIVLMVTVLALIVRQPQATSTYDIINHKLNVYNALKATDDVGDLKVYVLNNNATAIKEDLQASATSYMNYEVTIYNRTGAVTSEPQIDSENVVTISYFLAGYVGEYDPREVRVFMWGFD
jgi:hypothetical protein